MNIFETEQNQLLSQLQSVAGIVEKRSTVPVLSNVLIKKIGAQSILTTSDLEIQMQTKSPLGGEESDSYETTVSIRKLIDILRTLPAEQKVKLEEKDGQISLKAGRSNFKLQSLSATEFPLVKEASEYGQQISLPQNTLKKLLQQSAFAMAMQDIRHYLNGILIQTQGHHVSVVATDGHRLAFSQNDLSQTQTTEEGDKPNTPEELPTHELILPRKIVLELLRLLDDSDTPIQMAFASNQARFRIGDLEIISKLIEGKFPDYNRVIPQNHQHQLTVSRSTLQAALQRASVMMSDKFKGVRLHIEPGLLRVSSNNNEQEEALDEIDVDYSGPEIEIGFNVSYLQDVLSNLSQDMVQIQLQDDNSSALITAPGLEGFKYVVMPMRI